MNLRAGSLFMIPSCHKVLCLIFVALSVPSPVVAQSDHRDHFEMHHWDDYVGSYEIGSGRYLAIGLNWGGGLTYLDTGTGRFGTLTDSTDGRYADNSGSSIRFVQGPSGMITEVRWHEDGYPEQVANALGLKRENLTIPNGDGVLAGTLILPPGIGPHPAIIHSGGASWIVREQVMNEALVYASHGIAAFIYDKRGWGESTGDKTVPFETSAGDIVAISDYLRQNRTDLNPKQIGISTYSQSGWYGTLAASTSDDIAFLILNVPSATTVYRQEFQRVEHELRADGFSPEQIGEALSLMNLMSQFSRTGEGWDEYIALREVASEQPWFRYLFAPKTADPENWRWGRMNWEYNPLPALTKIAAPVLVLLGEHDKKVLPEVNRSIFEMALDAAGNRDFEIMIIPGMNHALVVSQRGGRTEETPNQMVPEVIQLRIQWLKSRL